MDCQPRHSRIGRQVIKTLRIKHRDPWVETKRIVIDPQLKDHIGTTSTRELDEAVEYINRSCAHNAGKIQKETREAQPSTSNPTL